LKTKAFIKQYGVEYSSLIAGAPAEMWEKVPQLVNLNTPAEGETRCGSFGARRKLKGGE
jgi:hypothetical protein